MFVYRTYRAMKFLVLAPFILVMLFFINWMTFHGKWWIQWAALGMGIAWVISLFRVMRVVVIAGGLAAFLTYIARRNRTNVGV